MFSCLRIAAVLTATLLVSAAAGFFGRKTARRREALIAT